jgi:hypothetical protein
MFGLVFSTGLIMSACMKQEIASHAASITGVYTLVSVNGKHVPTSISHGGTTLQVRSGTFVINADETCISKMVFIPPPGSEVVREVTAKYTKDGSRLTMQWEGAGKTVGIIQDNRFTMDNEGMELVYEKNE